MLKIETLDNLLGFGNSEKNGEYYFSSGIQRKGKSVEESWWISQGATNTTVAGLTLGNWFAEMVVQGATSTIFCAHNDGKIFQTPENLVNSWALAHTPATASHGNGLIVDQKNRLLYLQDRWLGMFDSATSVWNDSWKDLGWALTNTADPRGADVFEEWVFMGGESTVVGLNTLDDSITSTAFTLPAGFKLRDLKCGSNGVLIGCNFSGKGVIILWDGLADRSTVPWIWLENEINSIAKADGIWIVSTGRKFLITNGYNIAETIDPPVEDENFSGFSPKFGPSYPSGMNYRNRRLFFGNGSGDVDSYNLSRERKGLYIYDLRTKLWEFTPGLKWDQNIRSIFISTSARCWVSYNSLVTGVGNSYYLGNLNQGTYTTNKYFLITNPIGKGNTYKKAEGIVLDLQFSKFYWDIITNPSPGVTVKAKIANLTRQIWSRGQTNGASTSLNILKVDGTSATQNEAEVGDEVTVMQGSNAGETRIITAISNKDGANEAWTVESNFTHLTESTMYLSICPFKLISTKVIDEDTIKKNRLFIPVKNVVMGKHFIIKIEIIRAAASSGVPLGLNAISLIYNDLG